MATTTTKKPATGKDAKGTLGLILMGGGKSKDPNVFNPKEVYSFTRITLAPILILGGFVVEIFAIFRKDKKNA